MKKEFNIKLNPKNVLLGLLVVYSLFASFMWYDEWDARENLSPHIDYYIERIGEHNMENLKIRQENTHLYLYNHELEGEVKILESEIKILKIKNKI